MLDQRGNVALNDLPSFLKPDEVAAYLGVSRNTVYRWCKAGDIESVKVRKTLRIQKSTLLGWIDKQEKASCVLAD
ncbi:helix-turn-helix domain-containing protein [Paenibacillus sp. FSL L8-0708]|uniref:helix-turn-helix domain-containing protein n=1 Tax=Paenibacillus sp. FSL L8-0708 TaxID=2975311 RepID=UPI0030FA8E49